MPHPPPGRRLAGSRRRVVTLALLGLAGARSVPAQARFPERAITLVVPFAPGGIADLCARALAGPMARSLGQPVVVDNRPSAGSIVASQAVATARPDGHTLLLMSNANAVSVGLFKRLPYDPLQAFAPVSLLGRFDLGLFVAAGARFATLQELLAFARAQPGRLGIGTLTPGSTQHLAARLFLTQAGIDALVVPYKGSPALLTALRSGEVDLAFEVLGPMLPQLGAGVVRALAVTATQRHPALPAVPTVQQAGVGAYEVASWNAIAAPAGTPPAVIERLHRAVHEALATPAVRAQLAAAGMRLQGSSPSELQALLESEIKRWSVVIRAAGIERQ